MGWVENLRGKTVGLNAMHIRFHIRDLLWLTVVVALGLGWWLDHERLSPPKPYQAKVGTVTSVIIPSE